MSYFDNCGSLIHPQSICFYFLPFRSIIFTDYKKMAQAGSRALIFPVTGSQINTEKDLLVKEWDGEVRTPVIHEITTTKLS